MKAAIALVLFGALSATRVHAQGTRAIPLDAPTLSALPRETVDADSHGHALTCEGVALVALLRHAGAMPDDGLRGAQFAGIVEADARDGQRVAFSLGELDPATGGRRVYVVDRCNGAPLDDRIGPLRLLVPEDAAPARWLRQLRSITVSAAGGATP